MCSGAVDSASSWIKKILGCPAPARGHLVGHLIDGVIRLCPTSSTPTLTPTPTNCATTSTREFNAIDAMDESATLTLTAGIVSHALLATVAWTMLLPLSQLAARSSSSSSATAFNVPLHRVCMVLVAVLTLCAYVVALYATPASAATPAQHPLLASALLFCTLLQLSSGLLRPPVPRPAWWTPWHAMVGASTSALALYVLHHSVNVFRIEGWLRHVVLTAVVVGAVLTVAAHARRKQVTQTVPDDAAQDEIRRTLPLQQQL